jgi:hypothetical protein
VLQGKIGDISMSNFRPRDNVVTKSAYCHLKAVGHVSGENMSSTTAGRPVQKQADDYFFLGMALLILGMVFVGFAHSYYLAGIFHAQLPSLLVHVHGALFSCWILLLIAQVTLVFAGRVSWHKRLGVFGMILAGLMVLVGFATLIGAVRRHAVFGMGLDALFGEDVLQLVVFAVLVSWALRMRRDGPAHKRLMILATVALMGPAVARWPFAFVFSSAFVFFGIIDSFLIFLIAFDLWSRRKIHRVTILGSLLILVMQVTMAPVGHLAFWHRFTTWVQQL